MGRLRGRLRRVLRATQEEDIVIPQQDGSIAHFPRFALKEAFLRNMDFLRARANGEDSPEPDPLQLALCNAAHREPWHDTFLDMMEEVGPAEDLSEGRHGN